MLKNYLKIAFRNFKKNKLFVAINVLGLGIAIACCIIAYLNWEYNATFDGVHKNGEEVYRVNFIRTMGGRSIQNGSCPFPLAKAVLQNVPQVTQAARYTNAGGNFKVNNQLFSSWMSAVDPSFMEMFSYDFLEGNGASLADNRTVLLEETLKEKYFPGTESIVGETLLLINGDDRHEFKVGGVYAKQPDNSSFQAQAYISFDAQVQMNDWDENNWAFFNSTFLSIPDPDQVATVQDHLAAYVEVQNQAKEDYKVSEYYLDPFVGMAVRAEKEGTWNHWFSQSLPSAAAAAPGIMSLLLLLIACFNFTNTSIAIVNRRVKEIGVRKVMGSGKKEIILQFLGENILVTFMALIVGMLLAAFLVPAYSSMWVFLDIRFNLFENLQLIGFLILLLLFTAIVAGSYPALYVSNFQATDIFRGSQKFGGTNILTRTLLMLQFAISLMAIVCGFVFAKNATYQNNYDLGFDVDGILYAHVKNGEGYRKLRNAVAEIPGIEDMAGATHNLTSSWYQDPLTAEDKELDVSILDVGANYLPSIGGTILMGRNFKPDSEYDVEHTAIINEELAKVLGWDDPIDRKFMLKDTIELTVIGMVKDILTNGALWSPIEPMVMRAALPEDYRVLVAKTKISNTKSIKAEMDKKWATVFPDELSAVAFMDEEKVESRETNGNIRTLFLFLAFVAALLSIIGLFSMVSMNINKRLKELGIRKILGAPMQHIAFKISREFVLILLTACVLGSVGGYYLSQMLLDSIWAYSTPITVSVFLLAIFTLLGTSIVTVGRMIYRATTTIPVQLLQD